MENDNCVIVTHFINPHLFWYKTVGVPGEQFHMVSVFEAKLLELYKNKPSCDNYFRPQIGDKVAVNFVAWNKFIRAEILEIAKFQRDEYIVWILDYGFPLLTKKDYIRSLPSDLHDDIGNINVGGIANIYPAELEYDDMEGNLVILRKGKWLQKTCNILEKLLIDAISINFVKHHQTENGKHTWGDLKIVNHKGIHINARDYLLKTTNAIEEESPLIFKEACSKFLTVKIAPWLSNNRNTNVKLNNINSSQIEHSKQTNTSLIDENVKRKVEDWRQRNEGIQIGVPEMFELNTSNISEGNVDDVTCDDSVSLAQISQVNYIGKAGLLTKIKQQKCLSCGDLPPSAYDSFDIHWPKETSVKPQHPDSTRSGSIKISRLQKLAQFSIQLKEEEINLNGSNKNFNNQTSSFIDLESISSSLLSSVSQRQQKLLEHRKQKARAEKEKKLKRSSLDKSKQTENSPSNQTKSESYPYPLHKQSVISSTINSTAKVNIQNNKKDTFVKNMRDRELITMYIKYGSYMHPTSDGNLTNDVIETRLSTDVTQSKLELQQDERDKKIISVLNNKDSEIKHNKVPKPEEQIKQTKSALSTNNNGNESKLLLSDFDSLTILPAGFDLTRLQTYKDEKNHWHRKKSIASHVQTSSADELLCKNTNDQSCSSSGFFQTAQPKAPSKVSAKISNLDIELLRKNTFVETHVQKSSRMVEMENGFEKKDIADNNLSASDVSTSTISTVFSQKKRKRKKLKSPTSQLSKIEQILQEHDIEKENDHINTHNLKLVNASFSAQQNSLLAGPLSNTSSNNRRTPLLIQPANNSCSSHSSLSLNTIHKEKLCKKVFSNEVFIDVKHTINLPIIEGECKLQTKFIDHLVLAHSSIQLMAIENVADAPFLPEIHEEMRKMRVNDVYRIQVYAWSHVLRNNSLFVVNPSRSGKTWSYLPPLCNLLCCRKDLLKPSYGPSVIIIVASMKHVELVTGYCRRLMSGFEKEAPTCVPSYGIRNLIETKLQLLNGCGILTTTPSSLLRLLSENDNENLFDAERLQHIVIDDMDIMLSRFQKDFNSAISIIFNMVNKSKYKKLVPQLIVTTRDWDALLVKLMQKSNQPLLLIGDFLEAAVYGCARLSLKLNSSDRKINDILKFITKLQNTTHGFDKRTLIMCNEDKDVQDVLKSLHNSGHHCLGYYSRSTEMERVIIEEWKKMVRKIFVLNTHIWMGYLKI